MAGVKGRSGRKTDYYSLNPEEVCTKSLKIVHDFLKDPAVNVERKIAVARDFALKTIPDKVWQKTQIELSLSDSIPINEIIKDIRNSIPNGNTTGIIETPSAS